MKHQNKISYRLLSTLIVFTLILLLWCCKGNYTPKPYGYMRFDLPDKHYRMLDSSLPYKFEYPVYAQITKPDNSQTAEPYWINIVFPAYKATIYISYKTINNNLPELLEDTYQLVYKHTVKADAINEMFLDNSAKNVYGILYQLGGNTATAVQFYVTDSVKNFIRGSLYFYTEPNKDSLAPLINYFKQDIQHLMETTEWN